jgi:putative membrane protein
MVRVALAALHLIAFALGVFAVLTRGVALQQPVTGESLRRAFRADTLWGLAAALLLGTGLWRYLGSVEKSTSYYSHDVFFLGKMSLFALILALEVWPMITLLRWRQAMAHGGAAEAVAKARIARRISAISFVEASLVVLMVIAATSMARGFGAH